MLQFVLEICNFDDQWELDREFALGREAIQYGNRNLRAVVWRVRDQIEDNVEYTYDPQRVNSRRERVAASQEMQRQWREEEQQRANRNREEARDIARRRRLAGFQFVGAEPEVLTRRTRPPGTSAYPYEYEFDDDELVVRLDWRLFGF